jgi:organic hydroperoxide reductase OsmC/OhrA
MDGQGKAPVRNAVNGIDVDALLALIARVKTEPAEGRTHWRVATTWQGQTRSRSEVEGFRIGGADVPRRFTVDIDEPAELGGSNRFANPQEYLLAALNACMTVGYVAQCAVRGIALESLAIEPKARSTSGVFSASIPPSRQATRACATRCASRAMRAKSDLPRFIRR